LNRIPSTRNEVAFVGSAAQGNRHGITEILRKAWPEVLRARPDAVLHVYGKICTVEEVVRAKGALKNSLVLHGAVDDLTEAYQTAVVIAPLWAGSGLKIKVVEALCHGKAVITTPTGAQGLADGAGRAFRVAETPAEFATSILDLLEHLQRREALADAAYRYAADKFSEDNVYKELDQVLERSTARLARSA
jgi:glycosyltransferase involved in cell wall biosynthesis